MTKSDAQLYSVTGCVLIRGSEDEVSRADVAVVLGSSWTRTICSSLIS